VGCVQMMVDLGGWGVGGVAGRENIDPSPTMSYNIITKTIPSWVNP
jgi:hypothetical protein